MSFLATIIVIRISVDPINIITLVEGMKKGESIEELAARVKSVFNASANRARTIARTEVIGSTNFGRNVGMNRSGFKKKQWWTALDERVRTTPPSYYDHAAMHGKIIDIGQRWNVNGNMIRYPGDYMGDPANIINCRCVEFVIDK